MAQNTISFLWADIPDPDIIRVGDSYYMTSTTMHFTPGCPIMKSADLMNWEIVGYVYDVLENSDHMCLENGKHDYGRGSWASCLRYHNQTFYVAFTAYNAHKTYIFQSQDIESSQWERYTLDGIYHDLSLLFDDDGSVYMVYGSGTIRVIELTSDAKKIKPNGLNKVLIHRADVGGASGLPAEGAHIYKIDGSYYIFLIAWPSQRSTSQRRIQLCYRACQIDGRYEGKVVLDNDFGFHNRGVAQGGVFCTKHGQWYSFLFQDRGAVGRVPVFLQISWEKGWPQYPQQGTLCEMSTQALLRSDDFNQKERLLLQWQWNHNCSRQSWSLSQRPGWLNLVNGTLCNNLSDAHNTLTQRTVGPRCSGEVLLDTRQMKQGDFAGLAAFQDQYGYVGVTINEQGAKLIMATAHQEPFEAANMQYTLGKPDVTVESLPLAQQEVYLRVDFDFGEMTDTANFYYSLCKNQWIKIGSVLQMSYRLTHFVGYRFALFSYATKQTGGAAWFEHFHVL